MGGQWWGGQLTVPKSAVNIQVLDSTHMKKSSPTRGQIANCTISAKKVCVCGGGAWLWGAPGSYMVRGGGGALVMGGPGFYTCL